jgi:hypothetical protein
VKTRTELPERRYPGARRQKQKKVFESLIEHGPGLTRFVEHPQNPMNNHRGENPLRTPVTGRKNYYGSGSLRSADLAYLGDKPPPGGHDPTRWLRPIGLFSEEDRASGVDPSGERHNPQKGG